MAIKEIKKKEWQNYFNNFSKKYLNDNQPEYAEIRVLTDTMGSQPETKWLNLLGITYDDRGDLLEIQVDNLKRFIYHPDKIFVDESDDGWLLSFEVIQKDGTRDIIETR